MGADAIHPHRRQLRAADDVAAADHEADGDTHVGNALHLVSEPSDGLEVEAESLVAGQRLTGQLEENPAIAQLRHARVTPRPSGIERSAAPARSRRASTRLP